MKTVVSDERNVYGPVVEIERLNFNLRTLKNGVFIKIMHINRGLSAGNHF